MCCSAGGQQLRVPRMGAGRSLQGARAGPGRVAHPTTKGWLLCHSSGVSLTLFISFPFSRWWLGAVSSVPPPSAPLPVLLLYSGAFPAFTRFNPNPRVPCCGCSRTCLKNPGPQCWGGTLGTTCCASVRIKISTESERVVNQICLCYGGVKMCKWTQEGK